MLILLGAAVFVNVFQFAAVDGQKMGGTMSLLMNIMAVVASFFVMGTMQGLIYEQDERKKWSYYITSTEAGSAAQVGEKYILVLIISMAALVLNVLLNCIAIDLANNEYQIAPVCMALFFIQVLLRAVEIPFVMAFGSKKGNLVRGAIMLAALIVALVYLLFGDLKAIGLGSSDDLWDKLIKLIKSPSSNSNVLLALGAAGVCVLPLYYLSYRISCRVYKRGADAYEK